MVSASPVPAAVPAGQAGGDAETAEGRGGLLHPAGADEGPEAVPGSRGSVPVRQLGLAGLDLLSAAAVRLRSLQNPQSSLVAGQGPTGTAQHSRYQRPGAESQDPGKTSCWEVHLLLFSPTMSAETVTTWLDHRGN